MVRYKFHGARERMKSLGGTDFDERIHCKGDARGSKTHCERLNRVPVQCNQLNSDKRRRNLRQAIYLFPGFLYSFGLFAKALLRSRFQNVLAAFHPRNFASREITKSRVVKSL